MLIGELLAEANHPASHWQLQTTDEVECAIGTMLPGEPIGYDTQWSQPFHAPIWPFDATDLGAHPIADLERDLVPMIAARKEEILSAASQPFGVVHSDLHDQHLLQTSSELTGVLDFGDAFIGSTAWDFALIRWYYGADNAQRLSDAYGDHHDLFERGSALAVAVGCYKVAKSPDDRAARQRLRSLLSQ